MHSRWGGIPGGLTRFLRISLDIKWIASGCTWIAVNCPGVHLDVKESWETPLRFVWVQTNCKCMLCYSLEVHSMLIEFEVDSHGSG